MKFKVRRLHKFQQIGSLMESWNHVGLQGNCLADTGTATGRALLKNAPGMLLGKKVSLWIPKSEMLVLGVIMAHMGLDLEDKHWGIPMSGKLNDEAPQIFVGRSF